MNKKDYPYNFIAETFMLTSDEDWNDFEKKAPNDIEEAVEVILDAVASPTNKEILYAYYKKNMSFDEIKKMFDLRVGDIKEIISSTKLFFKRFYLRENSGPSNYRIAGKWLPYPYNILVHVIHEYYWNDYKKTVSDITRKKCEYLIEHLPPGDREIFIDFYREGMLYEDIAKKYSISDQEAIGIRSRCLWRLICDWPKVKWPEK